MGTNDPLELEVTNFGPIVSGRIDLRPLTVFVGPSNTGKSYLAILIYALHRFFGSEMVRERRYFADSPYKSDAQRISKGTIEAMGNWAEDLLGKHNEQSLGQGGKRVVVPAPVAESIRSILTEQSEQLGFEIRRCFGSDLGDLVRKGQRGSAEARVVGSSNGSVRFRHELALKPLSLNSAFTDEFTLTIDSRANRYRLLRELERLRSFQPRKSASGWWSWRFLDSLIELALPELVGVLHLPAHYLPADRTGVMHAHNVVVSALIERAAMTGLRPAAQMPMLSGVLADFLEQLIQIDSRQRRSSKSSVLHAERIEQAILQGAVQMEPDETGSYPRFSYRPEGWRDNLPLMNASSMVSELAPVVLFLRHLVRSGDLLIIEEPESHLHPAMQVEFTRQIANLVRSGIRVLVTTHSEWVLEELSNIVLASTVPKARKSDAGGNGIALKEGQVGVWAFKPKKRPKGTAIEEIKLDASGDLYSASFDDVSAETYNRWVTLGNLAGGDA